MRFTVYNIFSQGIFKYLKYLTIYFTHEVAMRLNTNFLFMLTKSCLLTIVTIALSYQVVDRASGVESSFRGNANNRVLKTLAENAPNLIPLSGPSSEDQVKSVQKRLNELGYNADEIDEKPGPKLKHALVAFQKMNGLERNGEISQEVLEALENPIQPQPAQMHDGIHTEADLERQVLTVYFDNKILRILPISSGTGKEFKEPNGGGISIAKTPTGNFTFFAHIWGVHKGHLGDLYNPVFFHEGGYAVHGDSSVPPYPASHGCIRITIYDSVWFEETVPLHTPILVSETALPTVRQR
jgi:hypothetical protein